MKGTHELGDASIAASPHRNHYIQFFHAQMLLACITMINVVMGMLGYGYGSWIAVPGQHHTISYGVMGMLVPGFQSGE